VAGLDKTTKHEILVKTLIEYSSSSNWYKAKKEWFINDIYETDRDYERCSCSHYPIKEIITIHNKINDNELIIGNCCIKKIIEDENDYAKFFQAIRNKKINKAVIDQSYKDGILNKWEDDFMLNVWRKRKLSEKQNSAYSKIKQKILSYYSKRHHDQLKRPQPPPRFAPPLA
jgi:hypothetical protein